MFFYCSKFFSCYVLNSVPFKCVSMNNPECKVRSKIINVNSNEPSFYPYSINVNKCSGSCNNINSSYAKFTYVVYKVAYVIMNVINHVT